jgi:hypothetical protein
VLHNWPAQQASYYEAEILAAACKQKRHAHLLNTPVQKMSNEFLTSGSAGTRKDSFREKTLSKERPADAPGSSLPP